MNYFHYIHRCDCRIPRISLSDPTKSPWERLYKSGNMQAFITVLGFYPKTFKKLDKKFKPYFDSLSSHETPASVRLIMPRHHSGGAKQIVTAHSCVALCLAYFFFKGPLHILQGWFGLTGTALLVWHRFTMILMIKILRNDPDSKVKMSSEDDIAYFMIWYLVFSLLLNDVSTLFHSSLQLGRISSLTSSKM
jgi:hypothetical protein